MSQLDDLTKRLDKFGRSPPVKLDVFPLEGKPFTIDNFNGYAFSSNILIPVDSFTFVLRPSMPKTSAETWDKWIRGGDAVQLTVDGETIATGKIDIPIVDTDDAGSRITFSGRDLMGYLEDNDAVNPDASIIYTNEAKLDDVLPTLLKGTRIKGWERKNLTTDFAHLFATNAGESKLAALQRFLDPLNAIAWMSPTGKLIIGRPSFDAAAQGTLGMRIMGQKRRNNTLNMRVQRGSGQIPNAILVVWQGNENLQVINKDSIRVSNADEPKRLYNANDRRYRCIPMSAPEAGDVKSGMTELGRMTAAGPNWFSAIAAREFARENINELIVSCSVIGHLNGNGDPYAVDQCYNIVHDAAGVDEKMYLFSVDYELSEDGGQVTHLAFCKLGTIVADANAVKAVQ